MKLREQFEKETGRIAVMSVGSVVSWNVNYVHWLESQLTASRAKNTELLRAGKPVLERHKAFLELSRAIKSGESEGIDTLRKEINRLETALRSAEQTEEQE